MTVSITGTRSELGRILARQRGAVAAGNVHINVAGQQANTLLHDGHAWKDFARRRAAGTRRALRSAHADGASMLVHASFAFVHAVERGAVLAEPLRSCGRCHPRMRSAGAVGAGARLRRAPGLSVRPGERGSARLSRRPFVSADRTGPVREGAAVPPPSVRCRRGVARCSETAQTRAGSSTPPTVTRCRSRS